MSIVQPDSAVANAVSYWRILLAVTGLTPQVLTETLFALMAAGRVTASRSLTAVP